MLPNLAVRTGIYSLLSESRRERDHVVELLGDILEPDAFPLTRRDRDIHLRLPMGLPRGSPRVDVVEGHPGVLLLPWHRPAGQKS